VLREDAGGVTVYLVAGEVQITGTQRVTTNYYFAGGQRICRQVEEASLQEVSGEQIRWTKAKAALTLFCTRLRYRRQVRLLHAHCSRSLGAGITPNPPSM